MKTLVLELRRALRGLARAPGFTAIVVLTLALGLGAATAVFSVVDSVLLEPLPYPEPDRLVTVGHTTRGGDFPEKAPNASATHVVYEEGSRSFEAMAIYQLGQVNLTGDDAPPDRVDVVFATRSLLDVLRVGPALGRTFTPEEDRPGGPPVAVLSHALWMSRFGGDPAIVGRTIRVNGNLREVVGVMPAGFRFPSPDEELWIPYQLDRNNVGGFSSPGVARLRQGVTPERAREELEGILPRVVEVAPWMTEEMIRSVGLRPDVHPLMDDVVGEARPALFAVMAMMGLVLLISCANVANLMLVRAEARRRETAVRSALGAGSRALLRESLVESGLLSLAGGALGLVLAALGLRLLGSLRPAALPRIDEIGMDGSTLAFSAAVILLASLAFGAIPVLRSRGSDPAEVLRRETRGASGGARSRYVRHLLVVSQMALALVLMAGSGLMLRSFQKLGAVDPGFVAEDVLSFRVALPRAEYPEAEAVARFHREFLERLEAIPGVQVAGATSLLPLAGPNMYLDPLRVEGKTVPRGEIPALAEMRMATPGYFEAMRIPLRQGRLPRWDDSDARSGTVVASEAVVRKFMPGEEPIGRGVAHGVDDRPWSQVVGVVGDVHNVSLTEPPMGAVYYPVLNRPGVEMDGLARSAAYAVRASVPPLSLVPAVRAALREMDPNLPLAEVRPLQSLVEEARAQTAFTMLMLAIAALVGLLLGSVGLYGVISYVTTQRTREIGVRLALGAEPSNLLWMVMRQGMSVAGTGVLVGMAGALAAGRLLASILYGVSAADPWTLVAVSALLLAVGALATWLPARRASAVEPVIALRPE